MARADGTARRAASTSDVTLGRFLLRWSWLFVIMGIVGVAGGWAYLQYGPLQYQSRALLTMRPQVDATGEAVINSNPGRYQAAAQALAGQATAPSVYEATSRVLAPTLAISADDIATLVQGGRIQVSQVGTSSFISVTATDRDPRRAWILADGYARGFLDDLSAQTRVIGDRKRTELTTEIDVIQQQLAAVPLNFNTSGPAETYSAVHEHLLESLIQAQTQLRMLNQLEPPLKRYGETEAPEQATSPSRVLVAGTAVGLTAGLGLAFMLELARQWIKRRRRRRVAASVAARPVRLATPAATVEAARVDEDDRREARPWASSATH